MSRDRLDLRVEEQWDGYSWIHVLLNGRDLLELTTAPDPRRPINAGRTFPRPLFYGSVLYASSPWDFRVPVLEGRYCDACCAIYARIEVDVDVVIWDQFGPDNHGARGFSRSAVSDQLGQFVFDRAQYESALDAAEAHFEPPAPLSPDECAELAARVAKYERLLAGEVDPHPQSPPVWRWELARARARLALQIKEPWEGSRKSC